MKHLLTIISCLLALNLTAQEIVVEYPYNPDFENDGNVGVEDLLQLLSSFGMAFEVGELTIDEVVLSEWLQTISETLIAQQAIIDGLSSLVPVLDSAIVADFLNNASGAVGQTSKSLSFPEGLEGTIVTFEVGPSISYLVEEGKNLYVTDWYGFEPTIDGMPMFTSQSLPLIVAGGRELSNIDDSGNSYGIGILTEATEEVEIIYGSVDLDNPFIVEEGKRLYVTNGWDGGGDAVIQDPEGNTYYISNPPDAIPCIVPSGYSFSSPYNLFESTFSGYLVDEDYFESSSPNSQSTAGDAGILDLESSIGLAESRPFQIMLGEAPVLIPTDSLLVVNWINGSLPGMGGFDVNHDGEFYYSLSLNTLNGDGYLPLISPLIFGDSVSITKSPWQEISVSGALIPKNGRSVLSRHLYEAFTVPMGHVAVLSHYQTSTANQELTCNGQVIVQNSQYGHLQAFPNGVLFNEGDVLASNLTCSNGCTDPPVYIHGYLVEVDEAQAEVNAEETNEPEVFHATDFEINEWNNYLNLEVEGRPDYVIIHMPSYGQGVLPITAPDPTYYEPLDEVVLFLAEPNQPWSESLQAEVFYTRMNGVVDDFKINVDRFRKIILGFDGYWRPNE